jgi:lipoyl(octanoyl) transferase
MADDTAFCTATSQPLDIAPCVPARPLAPGPWPLEARWLGRQCYDEAHTLQLQLREEVAAGLRRSTLLLLEHEPVVTVGRRGELDDLKVAPDELERRGVSFRRTERGGRATYHGPGQLVGYPIVPLRALGLDVGSYVCRLEEALIACASDLGVEAERRDGQPGLWVGDAKLGSVGIAVSRGVAWHGFALNVDPDLHAFNVIRPCGFDLPVTSIAQRAGRAPGVEQTAWLVAEQLARAFGLELTGSPL